MLTIAEVFYSIQGEGSYTGAPSVFVRTSGCNLRCTWCDTPYTSWEPRGEAQRVEQIVAEVLRHDAARHVVLTGGEPMLQPELPSLVAALQAHDRIVTIETAGTVWGDRAAWRDVQPELFSISPKLAHSTPTDPAWSKRHETLRIQTEVLRSMLAASDYQLKFVVNTEEDLSEIRALLEELGPIPAWKVLLMPQARSESELDTAQDWVANACKRLGYRYCDRLHLRLYGNTPGT